MSLKRVVIVPDQYKRETWAYADVEDVSAYLAQQFAPCLPEGAKIYHGAIAESKNITPKNKSDIEKLQKLEGVFYVVIVPREPISIATWIYYAIVAITTAYTLYTVLTMPKPPSPTAGSSNNELAQRSNQPRINGRIPDIFGRLRSYPDLIAQTFTTYVDGVEIEECVMCIGRGFYQILDMRDGDTDVANIAGTSVSVYDPFTSIVGVPVFRVGEEFTQLPKYVINSDSINGQTIEQPNDAKIETENVWFQSPNLIKASGVDFTQYFAANDKIYFSGAVYGVQDANISGSIMVNENNTVIIESSTNIDNPNLYKGLQLSGAVVNIETTVGDPPVTETESVVLSGQFDVESVTKTFISGGYHYEIILKNPHAVNANWDKINGSYTLNSDVVLNKNTNSISLDDIYTINSISSDTIALVSPSSINSDWDKLLTLPNQSTQGQAALVRFDSISSKYVGWFNLEMSEATQAVFNLFFPNGLFYQDSKGGVWEEGFTLVIELQAVDNAGVPIGEITTTTQNIRAKNKSQFGRTLYIDLPTTGSFRFRLSRTTPTQAGKTQDTCKVKSVCGMAESTIDKYGNVTVVRSKTVATDGALSLKERKLNCLVNRKLPLNGTGHLQVTRSAGQALINIALDEYIGRRTLDEIDIPQINAEIEKVNSYFGSSVMSEFNYTIDDDNLSFEEIAGMIASAAFCEVYRYGSVTRFKFEQPQENAVLLFNHRNKVPGSEKRTTRWDDKNYDGIELEYTSDQDDARIKYSLYWDEATKTTKEGGAAKNPLKISTTGIRNEEQAKTRAWREWMKVLYKAFLCEFDALDESELLLRNDAILIADNMGDLTQDGEIRGAEGLYLTTSQACTFEVGKDYYVYVQLPDRTVDIIPCVAGDDEYSIKLLRTPLIPIVINPSNYIQYPLYKLVKATEAKSYMYMLDESTPRSPMTNNLIASNYDSRFYQHDHDFV
ncbi:hypothetical protein B9X62_18205 [Acinetobacter pittii]|uniref:host specificity factor TipJ family phage tail protein n=1 Tax=Acinetobacter pittii TaxID=48296 RepID=UPI000A337B82|nr:host specificity factor TipJ family phage tail protein [Acinetobacter pittii]OTL80451.1 hypothetical protein B9X62_18205 [Acinetobacter pittii]